MFSRYLLTLTVMATGLLLGAVSLNLLVDPYGLYHIIESSRWNARKPALALRTRLAKPYQVAEVRPSTVVIGNSRAESGFDPEDPAWPERAKPVFNLAIAGSELGLQLRFLQHAVSIRQPKMVVVGLDFLDFLHPRDWQWNRKLWSAPILDFERRLRVDRRGRPQRRWPQYVRDLTDTLLSLDAVRDSVWTLIGQSLETSDRTRYGFNPNSDVPALIRTEGYANIFRHADHLLLTIIEGKGHDPRVPARARSPEFALLRRLLEVQADSGFKLYVYIHPYHARFFSLLDMLGLWPEYERWKRELVEEVSAMTLKTSSQVELWDFGMQTAMTSEPVRDGMRSESDIKYFWESGHYKAAVGHEILSAMIDGRATRFGARLSPGNIDRHIEEVRSGRMKFKAEHPEVAEDLRRTLNLKIDRNASVVAGLGPILSSGPE